MSTAYPPNGTGGQPTPPPIPASVRTNVLMGGANWQVDEEVGDVVRALDAFLLGVEGHLKLTADHRPIFFSRKLVEAWACAWAIKPAEASRVEAVTRPDVVRRLTTGGRA